MWSLASWWNFSSLTKQSKSHGWSVCVCVCACLDAGKLFKREPSWTSASRSGDWVITLSYVHKCVGLSGSWEQGQRVWQILCGVRIMLFLDPSVHSPCTPCWKLGGKPGPGACCAGPGWAVRRYRWWPSSPSAWPPTSRPPRPDICPGSAPSRWNLGASPPRRQPGAAGAEPCLSSSTQMDTSSLQRQGRFQAQDGKTGRGPANRTCTWKTNKQNWSDASKLLNNFSQYWTW